MQRIVKLIQKDSERMAVLKAVEQLNLPDCYVAAGFIRNMVWDHLHGYSSSPLNDIDVIYFSQKELDNHRYLQKLEQLLPKYQWQIKNQATMHIKNNDAPYKNTSHAMQYWPEIETAVGARIVNDKLEVIAPFGVDFLFSGAITRNPYRAEHIFLQRIASKGWLKKWPNLSVNLRGALNVKLKFNKAASEV